MEMPPTFARALVLQQQGRHEMAEREWRRHLVDAPDDPVAHSMLAISLLEQRKRDEAEREAREGVGRAPYLALAHYVLARVLSDRNREDEAAAAIAEAVRLDPADPDYHAVRGGIDFDRGRWADALAAAETALALDAEHVGATNIRALALVKLGRTAEAGAAIDAALARDPDDATTHANRGWTLLEQGRRQEALRHFRESLRLDPGGQWARAGMVEAIKAGNPLYALMLRYFLWMQKLGPQAQWGLVVGGFVGSRLLSGLARANPALAPLVLPILVAYACFAILTWLAAPLSNLLLFLHPFGRHALTDDQRAQGGWVGGCLLLAVLPFGLVLWKGGFWEWLAPTLVFGLLTMPVAAVFDCPAGWPRRAMAAVAGGLAVVGLAACGAWFSLMFLGAGDVARKAAILRTTLGILPPGILAASFAANWLASRKPTR